MDGTSKLLSPLQHMSLSPNFNEEMLIGNFFWVHEFSTFVLLRNLYATRETNNVSIVLIDYSVH